MRLEDITTLLEESKVTALAKHVKDERSFFSEVHQNLRELENMASDRLKDDELRLPEHKEQYNKIIALSKQLSDVLDTHEASYGKD